MPTGTLVIARIVCGNFAQAGMTPIRIIFAATKNVARACNRSQGQGTVELGKLAEFLVVEGGPFQDAHALAQVRLVIRSGQVVNNEGITVK